MFEVAIRCALDDEMRGAVLIERCWMRSGGMCAAHSALGCCGLGVDPFSNRRNSRPHSGSGCLPGVSLRSPPANKIRGFAANADCQLTNDNFRLHG